MNTGTMRPIVFISAERHNKSELANQFATEAMREIINRRNVGYRIVEGVYKMIPEVTYVLPAPTEDYIAQWLELASEFNQECILYRNAEGTAFLVYPNGDREKLGQLEQVTKEEAFSAGSYTYDPINETYWSVK